MRQMTAQRQRRRQVMRAGTDERHPPPDDADADTDAFLDGADALHDRGDGVRVASRGRRAPDGEAIDRELPDSPPPGWGDGEAA